MSRKKVTLRLDGADLKRVKRAMKALDKELSLNQFAIKVLLAASDCIIADDIYSGAGSPPPNYGRAAARFVKLNG